STRSRSGERPFEPQPETAREKRPRLLRGLEYHCCGSWIALRGFHHSGKMDERSKSFSGKRETDSPKANP
ncbi:MAG TPA: hypothetical protein VJJ02_01150, partial [Candidatus Paceibacterota bacterium]